MKKLVLKKKYSLLLKVLLIIIIVIALGNVIYRHYEEKLLKKEYNTLINYDLTKDNYNTSIKTMGSYTKIEESIKNYFSDYAKQVNKVMTIINDEKIKSMLSASNYLVDGPAFTNTTVYLSTVKEELQIEMTNLTNLTKKSTITSYIEKENLNIYYQKIYNSYMFSSSIKRKQKSNLDELNQASTNINNLIEQELAVITFLINNKTWTVKDDTIIFSKAEDLNTYNNLVNSIS